MEQTLTQIQFNPSEEFNMNKNSFRALWLGAAFVIIAFAATSHAHAQVYRHDLYGNSQGGWTPPPRDYPGDYQRDGYYGGSPYYPDYYYQNNEVQNGRTKREKDPANRFQFCNGGIGWVPFGKPCRAYLQQQPQNSSPTPGSAAYSFIVENGVGYRCHQVNGRELCLQVK